MPIRCSPMLRTLFCLMLLSVCHLLPVFDACAQAQAASTEFEVASLRPSNDAEGAALVQATPGRVSMTKISLQRLLLIAYDLKDHQLVGVPPWAESKQYDLIAKSSDDASVESMEGPMLRAFLEDRFKMQLHRETRALPLYELVISKGGQKLHASSAGGCVVYDQHAQPSKAVGPDERQPRYCGFHRTGFWLRPVLEGLGVSLPDLAANIARSYNTSLGRDVLDRTGITGAFDIHLTWSNDTDTVKASDAAVDAPSIFEALQEQLGLKLKPAEGPVEVLVIDHIETPTAN